jgi:hypothetical protein
MTLAEETAATITTTIIITTITITVTIITMAEQKRRLVRCTAMYAESYLIAS